MKILFDIYKKYYIYFFLLILSIIIYFIISKLLDILSPKNYSFDFLIKTQEKLQQSAEKLQKETEKMVNALRKPQIRGKWGESQLKNLVDLVGMLPYCEYETQVNHDGARPDMVIKLPDNGRVFVDSKTPLDAFFKYLDGDEICYKKQSVKDIKNHIYTLSKKEYYKLDKSPTFVILFIPVEGIWLSALEEDQEIFNYALKSNILVATPTSLIGILQTIHFAWCQLNISKDMQKINNNIYNLKSNVQIITQTLLQSIEKLHNANNQLKKCMNLFVEFEQKLTEIDIDK